MTIDARGIQKRKFTVAIDFDQNINVTIGPVVLTRTGSEELKVQDSITHQHRPKRRKFSQQFLTVDVSHSGNIAATRGIAN